MMEFPALLDLLRARRSVRRFQDRPVPREAIRQLVEAARWAPSNHNRQGFRFIALEDPREIEDLARAVREELARKLEAAPRIAAELRADLLEGADWFGRAPRVIMVLHKRPVAVGADLLRDVPGPEIASGEALSAAMAVENLLLGACALGLGACVLTAPLLAPGALAAVPGLPPGFEVTCLVALGYPAEEPPAPRRKDIDKLLEFRGKA